jgi:hypothetical protein
MKMKCICGYEHKQEFVKHDEDMIKKTGREVHWETTVGDEEFITIEGTFLIRKEQSYGPDKVDEVCLWACPKCGTLKIDI